MEAMKAPHSEMSAVIAERSALQALTINIQPAANRTYKLREDVLDSSEMKKGWFGPFTVVHVENRMITAMNKEKRIKEQ